MVNNKAVPTDKVGQVMLRRFRKVNLDTTLGRLARIFEKESYAVVVSSERYFESGIGSCAKQDNKESRDVVVGVVTPIDLLNFITDTENKEKHFAQKNSEVVEIPIAKYF